MFGPLPSCTSASLHAMRGPGDRATAVRETELPSSWSSRPREETGEQAVQAVEPGNGSQERPLLTCRKWAGLLPGVGAS